eukprot:4280183-Pleurochrysis_carterae.AAC.1
MPSGLRVPLHTGHNALWLSFASSPPITAPAWGSARRPTRRRPNAPGRIAVVVSSRCSGAHRSAGRRCSPSLPAISNCCPARLS